MSVFTRMMLIVILGLGTSCVASAQERGDIPQSPPAKIEGKFAISHSDRDDRTVVALAHQKVGGDNSCGIWVSAGYTYLGKPSGAPDRVYISFIRDSTDEPRFLKSETERLLVLTLDGEALRLGPMPSVKEITTGYSLTTQGFMLPVPYDTFRKIGTARKVDVQLGPIKFNLTDRNLQDFRDLQNRIVH